MLRYTVTLEDQNEPIAALKWYEDAADVAKKWSERVYSKVWIGFTPLHHNIETWENGERVHD